MCKKPVSELGKCMLSHSDMGFLRIFVGKIKMKFTVFYQGDLQIWKYSDSDCCSSKVQ